MRYNFCGRHLFRAVTLVLTLLTSSTCWAGDLILSPSEQVWLNSHPVIRLGIEKEYAPYTFFDTDGNLQGVAVEFFDEIERHLGIRFEIVSNLSWPELLKAVREHRVDALSTVVKLPERESFLEFSEIYLPTPLVIMTRNETPQLTSLKQLQQLSLILVKGYSSSIQLTEQFPDLQPHYVNSPIEGLRAVASGASDSYVGVLGINSFLASNNGLTNLKVNAGFDMDDNGQRFAVRKDWPQLALLLDKVLHAIPEERKNAIFQLCLPRNADEIKRLSRPGYVTIMFPWLLGSLGLILLSYLVLLIFNRRLRKVVETRTQEFLRANDKLCKSQERYRMMAENTAMLICRFLPDGKITYVNEAYCKYFEKTYEELVGLSFFSLIPEAERKFVMANITALSEDSPNLSHEHQVIRADNKVYWTRWTSCAQFDVQGKAVAYQSIGEDITKRKQLEVELQYSFEQIQREQKAALNLMEDLSNEIEDRKQAEKKLQKSENNYKRATEAGLIAVWRVDLPYDTVDSDGALERLLGYEPGEIDDWKKINHPDDRDRLEELWKNIHQKKTVRYDLEQKLLCKDGNYRWFSAQGQVIWNDETKGTIVGTTQNINERKLIEKTLEESEEKFRAISSSALDAIIMIDNEGNITYWNDAAENMFGESADEVLGSNFHEMFVPERFQDTYKRAFSNFQETGEGAVLGKTIEVTAYRKDGTEFPLSLSLSSVMLKGTLHAIGIVRDITERKQAEENRIMLEEEINQARKLEAVGSLAAGIAHEINTPIQFVGDNTNFVADSFKSLISLVDSYDSLWQEAKSGGDLANLDSKRVNAKENADLEYLREEIPSAIEQTLEGVQRVTKIVRAMKDFAHSDKGKKSNSDINDMLASCLTVAHNELKYVADIKFNYNPELPEIECYRDDLNQVFLNLLVNAAHAVGDVVGDASAGKGTITVSTERDNDNVIIKIKDTGSGIPKAVRDRIFDPFFSTKDVGKGSGQGLAIARKIVVDKHEGTLDFETEEGKGTTFIISLPIAVPEIVEVS